MGRQKTISDDEVLRVARDVFRRHGHTATTREIAQAAGISEAVLYQRFGSKDELFFAAMRPQATDVVQLLGPAKPPDDAYAYLHDVVVRMGKHFAEIIPLALRVMTHPSSGPGRLERGRPGGPSALQEGLAERIASLASRGRIATASEAATARVLVSLAHDWALMTALSHTAPSRRVRELTEMVDAVWTGLRVR
jgi:AcrR family transcriptional regulator